MIPTFTNNHNQLPWSQPMRNRKIPLVDYERGGIGLADATGGLNMYDWTAEYDPATQWVSVWRNDLGPETATQILQLAGIDRIGLAFDQNMRPQIAYTVAPANGVNLWYYSASGGGMTTVNFPGTNYPCLTLDDRRDGMVSDSDVILSYVKGLDLCFRVQRENYDVERSTTMPEPASLEGTGMTKGMTFQWDTHKDE